MAQRSDNELTIRRYLLGEAAEQEQALIEERLLTESEYFNRLVKAEEELTDDYVRGKLAGHDLERFEGHFMSAPDRRESVEFASALNRYVSVETVWDESKTKAAGRDQSRWRGLFAAIRHGRSALVGTVLTGTVLMLVLGSAWLLAKTQKLGEQIERFGVERARTDQREEELRRRIEDEQARTEDLSRQLDRNEKKLARALDQLARPRLSGGGHESRLGTVTIALVPGLSRTADQTATVKLSKSTQLLRLDLDLVEASYRSYGAEVQTVEGKTVWSRPSLKARRTRSGRTLSIMLPASIVTRSDYLVSLSGAMPDGTLEKIDSYYFRVVRE